VIHHRKVSGIAPRLAAGEFEALKGLWAGDFVDQVTINIDQAGAIRLLVDDVLIPQFVVKGAY
jgi:hypothetical protein